MADRLELLAPAGAWDSMRAAVQNGADAIYLGGRMCNARQFAGNFRDDDEMLRAIQYCHLRNVRVYVALNTLLLDRELKEVLHYAAFLYNAGADALIVQDMGLLRLLRKCIPEFELHGSTQICLHDENGLALCAALGLRRVVLSRELSLARIEELHSHAPATVKLECFAHGAMCTAVSGACLFSSLAGGRSGNRGACAQPCRKAYAVNGGKPSYPLSLQDMCMLRYVEELRQAGVACIKLEGRMKRPEYVGAMTRAYRMAIDGAPKSEQEEAFESMQHIFFRGNCTGYYYGRDVPAEVEPKARGVLPGGNARLKREQERYSAEQNPREIAASLSLYIGTPAILQLTCEGFTVSVQGEQAAEALKPQDAARYAMQIGKLGGTPFHLMHCNVDIPEPAYLPISAINALRNAAIEAMAAHLTEIHREPLRMQEGILHAIPRTKHSATRILAIVPDAARAISAFEAGADTVALEPRKMKEAESMLRELQRYRTENRRLLLQLPAVDLSGRLRHDWETLFQLDLLDGGVAQNAAQVYSIRGERIAGYLCNAANTQSVLQLQEMGFQNVLFSLELNRAQLRDLSGLPGTGVYAYGRAQLMQLWHCPQKAAQGSCACCGQENGTLTDEAGRVFSLDRIDAAGDGQTKCCLTRVRNCDTMDILDSIGENPQPEILALEFFDESAETITQCVYTARSVFGGCRIGNSKKECATARTGITRGHWARGWET